MRIFGLIGYPLSHSFSPAYFSHKFFSEGITDSSYQLFPLEEIEAVKNLLGLPHLAGLNVTIPYKEAIIPYLDSLDDTASQIGAVNTILLTNGKTKGYNTDIIGFRSSLLHFAGSHPPPALVLGTGGASKAVVYVLEELTVPYLRISTHPRGGYALGYKDLTRELMEGYPLIINTTPLGTYPHTADCPPLPYRYMGKRHLVYDLVYNPAITLLMAQATDRGARAINGYEMLKLQAEASWDIWNTR